MTDDAYVKLAKVLDTLPNGFPATETGIEMKILKKIFRPDQAELCCDLRLTAETAEQIAERTGRPLEGLKEKLIEMAERGQIGDAKVGDKHFFKMVPYAVGIYELQLHHLDKEFVELNEEYLNNYFLKGLLGSGPPIAQTIVIEEELKSPQEAMPYQRLSDIIDTYQSFRVSDCICKKEQGILENPCDKPLEVCLGISKLPNSYREDDRRGRPISREEAKEILRKSEEAGLVHLTGNYEDGQYFICNCCGCCCGILRGINKLNIPAWDVINSDFYAAIDPELCTSCGICADERCQINAIEEVDDVYEIIPEKCIGCGLCVTTCPVEAISLVKKSEEQIKKRAANEPDWFKQKGKHRGVDFSKWA